MHYYPKSLQFVGVLVALGAVVFAEPVPRAQQSPVEYAEVKPSSGDQLTPQDYSSEPTENPSYDWSLEYNDEPYEEILDKFSNEPKDAKPSAYIEPQKENRTRELSKESLGSITCENNFFCDREKGKNRHAISQLTKLIKSNKAEHTFTNKNNRNNLLPWTVIKKDTSRVACIKSDRLWGWYHGSICAFVENLTNDSNVGPASGLTVQEISKLAALLSQKCGVCGSIPVDFLESTSTHNPKNGVLKVDWQFGHGCKEDPACKWGKAR